MRKINRTAKTTADQLTAGLSTDNPARIIDNAAGAYMAVHVELVGTLPAGHLFSVAHYGEQNGDMMRDPDVVLLRGFDGNYYPVSFRNDYTGTFDQPVEFEDGDIARYAPRAQADIATFCNTWFRNIKSQQGNDLAPADAGATRPATREGRDAAAGAAIMQQLSFGF